MSTLVAFLHVMALAHLGAASDLQITTKGIIETKQLGDDIVLDCKVAGASFSPYSHQLVWYKSAKDGSLVQINTMTLTNNPFKDTGRYSLAFDNNMQATDPTIALKLSISGIELADNGTFTCKLLDESGEIASVEHSISVYSPIETLTLITNDTQIEPNSSKVVFNFERLTPSYVQCKSVGGNPKPFLRLDRGVFDISGELEEKTEEIVTGEKGLEVTKYEMELVTDDFRAEMKDSGEVLKCIARIHKQHGSKKTQSGVMDVRFAPYFHCEGHAYAMIGTENFTIDCKVRANPPVDIASIQWVVGENNGTNITTNSTYKGLTANITEDPIDKNAVHISLTINLVNETAYQGYSLNVKNAVGERHHEILLSHATTTPPTTTTKKPKHPKTDKPKNKPNPGAVGGGDDGAGALQCSLSLLLVLVTGALSW